MSDLSTQTLRIVSEAGVAPRKPTPLEKLIADGFRSCIPAMQAFAKHTVQLDKPLDELYLKEGQPYGPTKEGRQRWLLDVSVTLDARQEERKAMADVEFDLLVRRVVGRKHLELLDE